MKCKQASRTWIFGNAGLIAACTLLLSLSILAGCAARTTTSTPVPALSPTATPGPLHVLVKTFDSSFTITLDITPDHVGPNQFRAQVLNNQTHQAATHIVITLYATMQDMAMGTDSLVLHAEKSGQFSASSTMLSMGGHWALGITIQTPDHIIHRAGVSFVLPA